MVKAFLSHSSKDKKRYVEIVAKQLGSHNCIYDSLTFEGGMKCLEEILKGLGASDLFVIFLSEAALDSDWVRMELSEANNRLDTGNIKRIYPIIIDPNITYKDLRIPQWMREQYNLRLNRRPTVAARRIRQRMKEISWEYHPRIKEKERIFVGRNDLIKHFEERIDSFDKQKPICIIASGLKNIGRRTFLKKCFDKSNIIDESYDPPIIFLSSQESIEDFILKIYDFGLSEAYDLTNFMHKTIDDKISIACKIISEIQDAKERIFIIDNGCIVSYDQKIAEWFIDILQLLKNSEIVTFAIAASFRIPRFHIRHKDYIYSLDIPELSKTERNGLLKRYAEFEKLSLTKADFEYFANLLNGYPDQAFYAVELIKDLGITYAKQSTELIVDFNTERVTQLLLKYEDDEDAISFLYLLSEFDFISMEFIFEIVGREEHYFNLINEFVASGVCELIGANKEYIRVNDVIRDYVRRNRLELPSKYTEKLKLHLRQFLGTYKNEEKDVSDYLFSLKNALLSGEQVDEKYLIPSHYLKTIKDLYDSYKRYRDVIDFADRVLQNEQFLDSGILRDIRYYLCLALARRRDDRFLKEVQKIEDPHHKFLLGFYYRMLGRYKDAIARLEELLSKVPTFSMGRRELVQCYLYIEEYDKAFELAKQNYNDNPNNHYHVQAYFNCVIRKPKSSYNDDILKELLNSLEKLRSEEAQEMFLRAKAQYFAFYKNDLTESMNLINEAITRYPDVPYPELTKFEIYEKFNDIEGMKETLASLEKRVDNRSYFHNALIRAKCLYVAHTKGYDQALSIVNRELIHFTEAAKERLKHKLLTIASCASGGVCDS